MTKAEITYNSNKKELEKLEARLERRTKALAKAQAKAEKAGVANLSEYKIYVFAQEPELDGDGYYHFGTPVAAYDNPAATQMLNFAGQTGYRWIVLATVGEIGENEVVIEGIEKQETISMVKVDVVAGTNITADSDVFKYTATTDANKTEGNYTQKEYSENVVGL